MLVPFHRDHMCGKESPHAGEADVAVAEHRKGLIRVITVDFQCEEPPRNMLYCGGSIVFAILDIAGGLDCSERAQPWHESAQFGSSTSCVCEL